MPDADDRPKLRRQLRLALVRIGLMAGLRSVELCRLLSGDLPLALPLADLFPSVLTLGYRSLDVGFESLRSVLPPQELSQFFSASSTWLVCTLWSSFALWTSHIASVSPTGEPTG